MGVRRDVQRSVSASGRLVSRSVRLGEVPMESVVRSVDDPRMAWGVPGEADLVAVGAAAVLAADGPGRFEAVREQAEDVFGDVDRPGDAPAVARPRVFGGFSFHEGHDSGTPWTGFPGAWFVLPRVQFAVTSEGTYATVNEYGPDASPESVHETLETVEGQFGGGAVSERGPPPGVADRERPTDRETWRRQVRDLVEYIEAGDLEKAVLAQTLRVRLAGGFEIADVLDRLGDQYPECYRFAVRADGDGTFFGATPERLVSRRDGRLETGALAATVPRGDTDAEDADLAAELRESEKFRHEHGLVADHVRGQLRGHASNVSSDERRVRKLSTVQHLFTPITADTDAHVLELVDALHPTPAVGGLPPDEALAAIREVETFDRGWYAAPVGWFDAGGDGTFAVGIRSAVAANGEAALFAGNGIVADSDPDEEWEEVLLKYRPVLDQLE